MGARSHKNQWSRLPVKATHGARLGVGSSSTAASSSRIMRTVGLERSRRPGRENGGHRTPDAESGLSAQGHGSPTEATLLAVQRSAGNAAAAALVQRLRAPAGVQRDPEEAEEPGSEDVSVTGITVSADKVSVPLTTAVTAAAAPANATGVVYSVENLSVDSTNVTIGANDGAITVAAGQQGGEINVVATASDGSGAEQSLRLVEPPTGVASTSASGSANYGGDFVHTFSAPSGESSGLEGGNINERFASHEASPPWGGTFELAANPAGSHGWDLDSSGAMTGPDTVDIEAGSVDIGPLVHSTSNPNPTAALPQGFTMTQSLHAATFPGGALSETPFATVDHTRRLIEGNQFEVSAGTEPIVEDYSGPAAVTCASASPATVMASAPRPAEGEWEQNKVTVSANPIPSDAALTYSFVGPELECAVDADGEVSIGSAAGTVIVRALATSRNYDDVTITITAYVAPPEAESGSPEAAEPSPAPGATAPDS